jgi:hypothetical protein
MADSAFTSGASSVLTAPIMYPLLSDLRDAPVYDKAVAFLVGKLALGDGLGGFYLFQTSASGTEDAFMNTVISNNTTTGRWVRIFQKAKTYTQGIMVNNGGVKSFYLPGTTDSSGQTVMYLTDDNTSTGNALFTEVWQITPEQNPATAPSNPPILGYGVMSNSLKTMTCKFSQNNTTTLGGTLLSIVGSVINGLAPVPSGVTVLIKVDGI